MQDNTPQTPSILQKIEEIKSRLLGQLSIHDIRQIRHDLHLLKAQGIDIPEIASIESSLSLQELEIQKADILSNNLATKLEEIDHLYSNMHKDLVKQQAEMRNLQKEIDQRLEKVIASYDRNTLITLNAKVKSGQKLDKEDISKLKKLDDTKLQEMRKEELSKLSEQQAKYNQYVDSCEQQRFRLQNREITLHKQYKDLLEEKKYLSSTTRRTSVPERILDESRQRLDKKYSGHDAAQLKGAQKIIEQELLLNEHEQKRMAENKTVLEQTLTEAKQAKQGFDKKHAEIIELEAIQQQLIVAYRQQNQTKDRGFVEKLTATKEVGRFEQNVTVPDTPRSANPQAKIKQNLKK